MDSYLSPKELALMSAPKSDRDALDVARSIETYLRLEEENYQRTVAPLLAFQVEHMRQAETNAHVAVLVADNMRIRAENAHRLRLLRLQKRRLARTSPNQFATKQQEFHAAPPRPHKFDLKMRKYYAETYEQKTARLAREIEELTAMLRADRGLPP